ncbi:GreA/GreB family elongation factor [Microbulbifer harenosus]|uniref:Transcription elongation factor GreAB n=1 Tax=Microbulbifer harenosus TaxID=2576840 RepID=A0ABY2UQ04_9GAMM|nr:MULTISPECIES: GreA/GreB family elongation factor [Microbulbifer]QIL90881.1 transcription elongation factor GreAB [Microbulbifer sp. SH-1]TLM79099.1 transcription elongation factor GreAB [Microbulbifer harenosus]
MTSLPPIIVSREDREQIYNLLDSIPAHNEVVEGLYDELDRAEIREEKDMPGDVVRLNSNARFTNEASGKVYHLKLVLPANKTGDHCVSLLTPAGAALLGLKAGDSIEWPVAGKSLRLRLNAVE